jgi:hypothetical protein
MQKSFKQRLEALERLEAHADIVLDHGSFTWEDRELVYMAISVYAVTVDERGRLVRGRGD